MELQSNGFAGSGVRSCFSRLSEKMRTSSESEYDPERPRKGLLVVQNISTPAHVFYCQFERMRNLSPLDFVVANDLLFKSNLENDNRKVRA